MALAEKTYISDLKLPPQNIEAEVSTLGSLMLDKDAIFKVADILSAKDFYKTSHQEIYKAMIDLFARREPIDVLSVTARLKEKGQHDGVGGASYLTSLVNAVPTASHVGHYASIVKKKRLLRDLIEASHHIAQLGYKEAEDVDMLLDEAEQRILGIAKDTLNQEFIAVKEVLDEAWERIDLLHKGDGVLRGVPTGFADLDTRLSGLQKSDFIVLASRPSLGKTSLALNIAKNAAAETKKAVGVFSLEMSREQIIDRLIATEANVDLWRIRTGKMRSDGVENDFTRVRDAMESLSNTPLYIDDSPSPSIMELRAKARRLQANHDLGLLVIDYLQLIRGREGFESRVQEVSEISRSLKGLAKELNIPILALSQLSRAVEMRPSSRPKLSDLRESGCLSGDTLIVRADTGEPVTIKELVGQKNVPVFSLNKNWELETRQITKIFSSGRKQLFEIRVKSGRTVRASANHPFLTIQGWRRLDELEKGSFLALPRLIPQNGSSASCLSTDEIILLAHLIGDGCVLPRQPIHYTSADTQNIAIVAETAKKIFGIIPRIVPQKNWFHVYLPSPYRLARNTPHPITRWFRDLGLQSVRSYEKKLPSALFAGSTGDIQTFLHHLWATDGNISWKKLPGRMPAAAIYYASSSKILAKQVQHLLLRLGILSSLRIATQKKGQKTYRPIYTVAVEGSIQQLRFCKLIGSFGKRGEIIPKLIAVLEQIVPNPNTDVIPKEAWKQYIEPSKVRAEVTWRAFSRALETAYCGSSLFRSGLSRERMGRVAEILHDRTIASLAKSDIFWDEIVSIVPREIEEVYDATVPETHNFLANDFIVHNSIEQDADVVILIYREDKAKENSEKRNIAEILIEKHRNGPTGKIDLFFHEDTASFRSISKYYEEPI